MTDPQRAERVWLPMALCTFKFLAIGDATEQDDCLPVWGATLPTIRRRPIRLVRLGWLTGIAAQASHRPLPPITPLSPDTWPDWPLPAAMQNSSTPIVA